MALSCLPGNSQWFCHNHSDNQGGNCKMCNTLKWSTRSTTVEIAILGSTAPSPKQHLGSANTWPQSADQSFPRHAPPCFDEQALLHTFHTFTHKIVMFTFIISFFRSWHFRMVVWRTLWPLCPRAIMDRYQNKRCARDGDICVRLMKTCWQRNKISSAEVKSYRKPSWSILLKLNLL